MKFYAVVICVLLAGIVSAEHIHHDGQPGCKEPIELEVIYYRNTWDPTKYWRCEQKDIPAVAEKCPHAQAWLDSQKSCVDWEDWIWEEPTAPPSRP